LAHLPKDREAARWDSLRNDRITAVSCRAWSSSACFAPVAHDRHEVIACAWKKETVGKGTEENGE